MTCLPAVALPCRQLAARLMMLAARPFLLSEFPRWLLRGNVQPCHLSGGNDMAVCPETYRHA